MKWRSKTLIALALLIVSYSGWVILLHSGALGEIAVTEPKNCEKITVSQGAEDIHADKRSGYLFVSAWNREPEIVSSSTPNGIYGFSASDYSKVEYLSENGPEDFNPHGISLWDDGKYKRFFAVNHKSSGEHTVEIFDVSENHHLTHIKTVQFDEMYSPNDVQPVGPDSFYATNDRGPSDSKFSERLVIFLIPMSTLVYHDGTTGRTVARGLTYANGIAQSNDGQFIYVAETATRNLVVYRRDANTNELDRLESHSLNQAPDNIDVDENNLLWIAGHPDAFGYMKYRKDPERGMAPSHVVTLDVNTGTLKDVYYNNNDQISGSTIGMAYKNRLYIGSAHENFILSCEL